MSDICQQISDAYAEYLKSPCDTCKIEDKEMCFSCEGEPGYKKKKAKALLALMPEFTRQYKAGMIVELPCKVGDTVYAICENNSILKTQVMGFECQNGVWAISTVNFNEHRIKNIHWFRFDAIGKTVFLTEQEALKVLERNKEWIF